MMANGGPSAIGDVQCDQTFCEKSAQFCQNIGQNGALVNKKFCPNKWSKLGNFTTKVAKI
jgi:hypothetical protein